MHSEDVAEFGSTYLDELRKLDVNAKRITDKMPINFLLIGLITMSMPNARIIHCTRHAIDTCFSIYTTQLSAAHPYSTDMKSLAHYYRHYHRMMDHWRDVLDQPIYDVAYESLVAETEVKCRELVSFCGLEWDDACLHFHEQTRAVTTASVHQVRQPIYRTSVARYTHYEKHLGPLIDGLAEFLE
jgi:hypothetical protein